MAQLNPHNDGPNTFITFADRLSKGDDITVCKEMWRFRLEGLGELLPWLPDVSSMV
jgi:hypothetical protein